MFTTVSWDAVRAWTCTGPKSSLPWDSKSSGAEALKKLMQRWFKRNYPKKWYSSCLAHKSCLHIKISDVWYPLVDDSTDSHLGLLKKKRFGRLSSNIDVATTEIKPSITATVQGQSRTEVILEIFSQHSLANALLHAEILSGVEVFSMQNDS